MDVAVWTLIEYLILAFFVVTSLLMLLVAVVYVRDITQTDQAIRRNFPVIGRFRYLFEKLGEFFRQ